MKEKNLDRIYRKGKIRDQVERKFRQDKVNDVVRESALGYTQEKTRLKREKGGSPRKTQNVRKQGGERREGSREKGGRCFKLVHTSLNKVNCEAKEGALG